MKKLIILLLSLNISSAQNVILDTNTIIIGQQVKLTISNKIENTNKWPHYNDTIIEGIEIIKRGKIDTSENNISQEFIITAWDSGFYYIPPISFSGNIQSEGLVLNVKTVILEEGSQLKDIKEPMKAPLGWSDVWPWLIIVSSIILIIFLIKKHLYKKQEPSTKIKPKTIIPAHITALQELLKLEQAKLCELGKIKEYYTEISEITRRYIENRFNFIALELTTDEILNELKHRITDSEVRNIRLLLTRADLAKFAKNKPSNEENKESIELAKQFITNTKEKKEQNA